jgi:hypothetical protein
MGVEKPGADMVRRHVGMVQHLRYPLILRDPESASEGRVLAEKFCVSLDEGP